MPDLMLVGMLTIVLLPWVGMYLWGVRDRRKKYPFCSQCGGRRGDMAFYRVRFYDPETGKPVTETKTVWGCENGVGKAGIPYASGHDGMGSISRRDDWRLAT